MSYPTQMGFQFSPDRARTLTDQVKHDARLLWTQLLDLYEGGAHLALGYESWADYCAAEFDMSKAVAYRLLQAARVVGQLPMGNSPPQNERQARELARLPDPEQRAETWAAVIDEHGDDVTAADVRAAVDERQGVQRPTPAPRPPPITQTPTGDDLPDDDYAQDSPKADESDGRAVAPATSAIPFTFPPEPEASPEEKAYDALQRQRLLTRFDPVALANVVPSPADALPGFEAYTDWLARFTEALSERARNPLRLAK